MTYDVLDTNADGTPDSISASGDEPVGAGESIEDALASVGPGGTVTITEGYDLSVEALPINVTTQGVTIQGGHKGEETEATITNATGSDLFTFNPSNQYNPGITIRDMNILQTAGGTAFRVQKSKFNYFENVHVDANGGASGTDAPLWLFNDPDGTLTPNSQIFVNCSAEDAGQDGFEFGSMAHHVAMFGCTAINCGRMGVYVNGPYSFAFVGGQLEDCAEPGLRARQCDSVYVGGNTYVEGNATTAFLGNVELSFANSDNCVVEGPIWANSKTGGTAAVVRFDGVDNGSVRHIQTDSVDSYDDIVYIATSSDIDVHQSSHVRNGGAGVANVQPSAARVRDDGVIVGAGGNNGGNGDLRGVDTDTVTGQYSNDRIISDGTSSIPAFAEARWDDATATWVSSSGGSGAWTSTANGGVALTAQDLSLISGAAGVIYRHNGDGSIQADGAPTSAPGYYLWSGSENEWKTVGAY